MQEKLSKRCWCHRVMYSIMEVIKDAFCTRLRNSTRSCWRPLVKQDNETADGYGYLIPAKHKNGGFNRYLPFHLELTANRSVIDLSVKMHNWFYAFFPRFVCWLYLYTRYNYIRIQEEVLVLLFILTLSSKVITEVFLQKITCSSWTCYKLSWC